MVAIYPSEIVQAETGYSDPKLRREAPDQDLLLMFIHICI